MIITLQYLGASIRNYFGDGADLGMHLEYVVEDRPLGTAGSVKNAASLLDETFVVISGDALTDVDLTQAVAFHRDHVSQATLVLARVPNPLEYGVVITAADGRIERFLEKPSWGEVLLTSATTPRSTPAYLRGGARGSGVLPRGGAQRLVPGRLPGDASAPGLALGHGGTGLLV